ncbi:MAG: YIP1 family protein, partial [candidate division Zixibacteria bacterium]|nr:YIP1 family protein [candidate division Zixibacteria bacterium]
METPPISNSPSGYPVAGSNSGRSITSLMMGVFTAPGQTFDEFCKRPRLIVPLITVLILAAITGAVTVKQTGMIQYDMLKTSTTIPASALEEIHQKALDSGPVSGALGPFFGILIGSIIGALIAWFLGSFVFGGKAKFSAVWAVGIMGSLISVVGG